jgi:hypothetical protein
MSGILETVVFHFPCCWGASPGPLGEVIPPGTNGQFDLEEGLGSQPVGVRASDTHTEPGEV